ncbi:hypothetical protein LCGC14_0390110 [marine sediment metagenome]|uniref:Uncharacterized protein n=1 Tax=marine sediment metagenome TaxID=412755 RepID=A0A0F9T5N5_9ZZZZ
MAKAKANGFAAAALEMYKDKLVEINTGEVATSLQFADHTVGQKHVIRGHLREVIGDGIVIECNVGSHKQQVLINAWSVVSIMELQGKGNISDIYIDEYKERNNIRNLKRQNK